MSPKSVCQPQISSRSAPGLCTCKKSTSSLTSFLKYCKDIENLLFWELWECLIIPIKIILPIISKLPCLSECKKLTSSLNSFSRYCFGYSGNAWLCKPKVILSKCRKLHCSFVSKEVTSPSMLFWRYCKDVQTYFLGTLGMPGCTHPK